MRFPTTALLRASAWHPPRTRDLPLIGLILLCLLLIGLDLQTRLEQASGADTGGWRHIDRAALQHRIDRGELRDRRADWFHPTRPDESPNRHHEATP